MSAVERASVAAPESVALTSGTARPSASQYADWFADELLSDPDFADWRKKHASRYPDMRAVGILVLSTRNQTSDPQMDDWMKQLVSELAACLRPHGLLIVGIHDTDPEPGSAPKASLGLSFSVRALPRVGGSPPAREVDDRPGTDGFPVEIDAELVDGVSRRTVAEFRVRPPS